MKRKITCLVFMVLSQFFILKSNSEAQNKSSNVRWDQSTLRQITPSNEPYANYGRIIQTKTGNLLCIYESKNGIECVKSIDLGKTWTNAVLIAENIAGVNMAVPEIIELKDRSLLASYNPRPKTALPILQNVLVSVQKRATTRGRLGKMKDWFMKPVIGLRMVAGNLHKFSCHQEKFNCSFLMKKYTTNLASRIFPSLDLQMQD